MPRFDLDRYPSRVKRSLKGLTAFLDKLNEIVPEDLPELVTKLDKKVWEDVSCTECANCCKVMTPTYHDDDIERLAAHFHLTPSEFKEKWLKQEEVTGEWVNKSLPCQFLEGNKCGVYAIKPRDCTEFPHHHLAPFDSFTEMFKTNLTYCPATFLLVGRLKKIAERDYEW